MADVVALIDGFNMYHAIDEQARQVTSVNVVY